jgi:hypothetical protein
MSTPLRFVELLRLRVEHDYFDGGLARGLRFEPEPDCAAWLRRHELIVRQRDGALLIAASEAQLPRLWDELRLPPGERPVLAWTLRAGDPSHALYTDRRARHRLVADDAVASAIRSADTGAADGGLPAWSAALPLRATLCLPARRSTWKYLLVGDWPDVPMALVEREGRAEFRRDEPETLDDGRVAAVFRSTRRLPLRERGALRLELRETDGASRRLLTPVPLAAPAGLICEHRNGRRRPVHEIFLNR